MTTILKPSVIAIWAIVQLYVLTIGTCDATEPLAPSQADLQALMQLSGSGDIGALTGEAVANQILILLHRSNPNSSPQADAEIRQFTISYIRSQAAIDKVTDQVAQIYARHLSNDDVQQLLQFYRSPIGRKLVSSLPTIGKETAELGKHWTDSKLPGLKAQLAIKIKNENLLE